MTKTFISAMVTCILITFNISQSALAQNSSPYWSLSGNNNATSSSKLGTTNAMPLRFLTNNTEKMRIEASGQVGIGTSNPVNLLTLKLSGGTPSSKW